MGTKNRHADDLPEFNNDQSDDCVLWRLVHVYFLLTSLHLCATVFPGSRLLELKSQLIQVAVIPRSGLEHGPDGQTTLAVPS